MSARVGRLFALAALLLAACATPPPPAPVVDAAPALPTEEPLRSQPLRHLLGRNLKPMPVQALNVRTRCSFRDEVGTRGQLDLLVKEAVVQRFAADVSMRGKGSCRFELKDFTQTEQMPSVLLADAGNGCKVRMWQQERGVTVAFNGCSAQCSGDASSYLWPILVDAKSGRCF